MNLSSQDRRMDCGVTHRILTLAQAIREGGHAESVDGRVLPYFQIKVNHPPASPRLPSSPFGFRRGKSPWQAGAPPYRSAHSLKEGIQESTSRAHE